MTRLFTGNLLVLVSFSTLWVVTYSCPNQSTSEVTMEMMETKDNGKDCLCL